MEAAALRNEAEHLRRNHDWKRASEKFSDLLDIVYSRDGNLSAEVCNDLLNYAECLVEGFSPEDDADDSDLENAWDCLEHARVSYEKMEAAPRGKLADVYDLLGQISIKNGNFDIAASQFENMAAHSVGLSWRVRLNALFMRGAALHAGGKEADALAAFTQALAYIDGEREKPENANDRANIADIRERIDERFRALRDGMVAG
jgi:tetratricopeptide (TPR) repeat protein